VTASAGAPAVVGDDDLQGEVLQLGDQFPEPPGVVE
jgi:hypothetical protein